MGRLTLGQLRHSLKDPIIFRATMTKIGLLCVWPVLFLIASLYRRIWIPSCRIIVVVGSFGKTTTAHAIAHTLGCESWSQIGGNPRPLVALGILRLRRHHRIAVLELGIDDRGQMSSFAKMTRPDVVVVTSIGSEHLQQFKSIEATRQEKSKILQCMPAEGLVILNGEDPNVLWMRECTAAQIVTCGYCGSNEIRASEVEFRFPPAMSFQLSEQTSSFAVRTWLIGHSMVFPLLAAYAVARSAGMGTEAIIQRFADLRPVERRMEPVPLPNGVWALVDDCKSLPETIDSALLALASIPAVRSIVVMGEVGGLVGEPPNIDSSCCEYGVKLGRASDLLVLVTQDQQQRSAIKLGVTESGLPQEKLKEVDSFAETVTFLRTILRPGDLVLFKGRFNERLVRIVLALQGREVSCWVTSCEPRSLSCLCCSSLCRS